MPVHQAMLSAPVATVVGGAANGAMRLIQVALDLADLAAREAVAGTTKAKLFALDPPFGLAQPAQLLVRDLAGATSGANTIGLPLLPGLDAGRPLWSLRRCRRLLRQSRWRESEQTCEGGGGDSDAHELLLTCARQVGARGALSA
ncbi:MAG TPA: hypothetical protein VFO19_03345 [Vicinamibacterales bacterium]|nr:hypothetical protein [Vicinamibacterales bacterium]